MRTLFTALLLYTCLPAYAQADSLYTRLKTNDSLLFNIGFNTCDLSQFENLISTNFEFYHDEGGITGGKQAFIASIQNGICKLPYKATRVLKEGSLKVFPLKNKGILYGAVQTGSHHFYAKEANGKERQTSTALFTHLWLLQDGKWLLSRALSYEHKAPDTLEPINENLQFTNRQETEKWMRAHHIPALGIGYIENGKIQQAVVYGKNENGSPYPNNTVFNVASLTKPVTALVALTLVNNGQWDLDEPLYKYWTDPDIATDAHLSKLTTRHILSHRSGFPNWRDKTVSGKLHFEFEPGTKYQYSGEGFEYLRKAIEAKFKTPLHILASKLVFQPLKMNDTRFFWDEKMDEKRFAKWHKSDGTSYKTYKNNTANAADDLLTTVEDYCKLMVYVMNGAGLNKDIYRQMVSEQTKTKPRQHFGLGWCVDENVRNGEDALTHGGDDIGVHTITFILPKSKQGLLIFTNCDNGTDVYIPALQHYLGAAGQEIIDIETK